MASSVFNIIERKKYILTRLTEIYSFVPSEFCSGGRLTTKLMILPVNLLLDIWRSSNFTITGHSLYNIIYIKQRLRQ